MGLALSGIPAVAMAYIAEEISPKASGFAMGLYIGGTAIGGMAGRLLIGVIADFASWRIAIAVIGVLVFLSAMLLQRLLPDSTHFTRRPFAPRNLLPAMAGSFRDPGLRWLYAQAFLLMGSFITTFNYIGFRLSVAPYFLTHAVIALIFLSYMVGTGSSAWAGALADRIGRRKVLWWLVLTMLAGVVIMSLTPLFAVIAGIVILVFGFFGAHSIASGWVGRRAQGTKAQASSLYFFFYYMGSSVAGTAGGWLWNVYAWPGVSLLVGVMLALALLVAIRLVFLPPLPLPEGKSAPVPVP
jgi:YNFM family putative membrane transporter